MREIPGFCGRQTFPGPFRELLPDHAFKRTAGQATLFPDPLSAAAAAA